MKIAIFTDVLLEVPGGIGSSITAIKKSLESAGHHVLVFAPGWRKEKDPHIIVVPALKFFRPNGAPWAKFPRRVATWIRQTHPELADFDLFHAHYEGPVSLAAIELARQFNKPLVQTLHGREDQALAYNIPRSFQPAVAAILDSMHRRAIKHINRATPPHTDAKTQAHQHNNNTHQAPALVSDPTLAPNKRRARMWRIITEQGNAADLVIAPSKHFADKLRRMGLKTPVKILPNGIDDDIVPISPQPRRLTPGQPLKILWNSRLSREKRFLPLLEALRIAGEQGLDYELTAFGGGNDAAKAAKFIAEHKLRVKLMGSASRNRILRESTRSHFAVITSYDFDVHSLILVEAEACGTPLLICDPDMVASLPKDTFILTRTPAPADIATALLELAANPKRLTAMSERLLAHRHAVYQSARVDELIKIYQSVIK